MITSREKDKFEVGKVYWSFYNELTYKGNKLRYCTGPFQAEITERQASNPQDKNKTWFIWKLDGGNLPRSLARNIHVHFNGIVRGCNFYDTYEECVEGHDEAIARLANRRKLTTKERAAILKKTVVPSTPDRSDLEIAATEWYEKLPSKKQEYVKWIKEHLTEL